MYILLCCCQKSDIPSARKSPATYENLSFTNVKTIMPTAITQVNIESLYNYGVGDFPRKTAEPFDEEADKYEIAHEFCK